MSYPDKPQISYSYSGFQQSQGNNAFPGTQMDADLASLKRFASTTVDFLALFTNSDGSLKSTAIIGSTALTEAIATASSAALSAQSYATAASGSALQTQAAASEAASLVDQATTQLGTSLLKASNLSDLAAAARTNLGLASFATKSSIVIGDFAAGFFTADTAGRAPFADGIWTTAKIANDAVDYTKVAVGAVIGNAYASTGAVATTTTVIPNDDTIPQITEGAEFLTCSITPKSATSILRVTAEITCSPSVSTNMIAALFRDATANAIGAAFAIGSGSAEVRRITVTISVVAGSTSATTFRLRAGLGNAGTLTVNGSGGARLLGGVALTTISITEFKA